MTPVNVKNLERLLRKLKYDVGESRFLVNGFSAGFDLQYRGPKHQRDTSKNIPFKAEVGDKFIMCQKIMKEVSLHRFAGPYNTIPYKWYVQSLIGLVPKAGGKTRLIFHLSFNFAQYKSINHYTPSELCSVKYQDLDHAVRNCLKLLQEHPDTKIWIGKTDILSAFRILPTLPSMWCYFILKAENPHIGTVVFFIDKCLPFGSRISCVLFQWFSNALVHILAYIVDMKNKLPVTNYLDDFLFLARTLYLCNKLIQQFLFLCMHLGVPIADEKTFWAALQQVFEAFF